MGGRGLTAPAVFGVTTPQLAEQAHGLNLVSPPGYGRIKRHRIWNLEEDSNMGKTGRLDTDLKSFVESVNKKNIKRNGKRIRFNFVERKRK